MYVVEVEHLPDRHMRLWLREGGAMTSLGTVEGVTGMYPVVKERVADHLALTDPEFYVELRIPRPSYVHDGDHVTVVEDDGRRTDGVVRGWLDGSVLVSPFDESLAVYGLFAPETVSFPDDD
jgi:hypothetical protein